MPSHDRSHHTAVTLGEMREFMRHTRQQVDRITVSMDEMNKFQRDQAIQQQKLAERQEQTYTDLCTLKENVATVLTERANSKLSRKAKISGAVAVIAGLGLMTAFMSGDVVVFLAAVKTFLGVLI